MDEEYDVVILGTGLKECILSGLLSVAKKKVLHMDRNDYYGADSASLNLKQLHKKLNLKEPDEKILGKSKEYNIDLCPKFIMANGNLVKVLLHTKVTRYLEFQCVDGSYIIKGGSVHEVPVNAKMALSSSLLGFFQKRRYKNFLQWVMGVNPKDRSTWGKCDLTKQTMKQVFKHWVIEEETINFTGHAVGLRGEESYLEDHTQTLPFILSLQLYANSLARYEKSPYIYPMWGLGGLPEGFSRLAAVHGGVYMLRKPIKKIEYNADSGKVIGVVADDENGKEQLIKCKQVVGDPSYFLKEKEKVKKGGQIFRWIFILDNSNKSKLPIEGMKKDGTSGQIIIPTTQTKRKSDIYISVVSKNLQTCPSDRLVAVISSNVYTENPKKELKPAVELFDQDRVLANYGILTDLYEPVQKNVEGTNVFITKTMNATTHFEDCSKEVIALYKQITGKAVDLSSDPTVVGTDDQYM